MTRGPDEHEAFVRAHAALASPPLVPEVKVWLASEVTPLWHATQAWLDEREVPAPFWAFAWAGGQGLARWILDDPASVRGATVLDFASGGGLVAIAAARAGASRVVAVDTDPFARAACSLAAAANGALIEAICEDWVGRDVAFDVVTAGDVWYEAAASARFEPWLRAVARTGTRVLFGDPARTYVPASGVRELARYEVPTPEDLEGLRARTTRVVQILG